MPNWLTSPLLPSSAIKPAQDAIDTPTLERGPWEARLRGFGAGALEGLRQQTSPLALGSMLLGAPGRGATAAAEAAPAAIQGLRGAAPLVGRAAQAASASAADLLNPGTAQVMERMHQAAAPVVKGMGAVFEGDRSVGGLHALGQARPAAETLGEIMPEFTPSGGESMYNLGKQALSKIADPSWAAYHRLLAAGGR